MTPQLMTILAYAIAVPVALLQRLVPAVELGLQFLLFMLTDQSPRATAQVSTPVLQAVPYVVDTAVPEVVDIKPKRVTRSKRSAVTA